MRSKGEKGAIAEGSLPFPMMQTQATPMDPRALDDMMAYKCLTGGCAISRETDASQVSIQHMPRL